MRKRPQKILVIMGHHRTESYAASLAEAYAEGAREGGASVEILYPINLAFDPILKAHKAYQQELEPDLKKAQELISWADHLVWVFPVWWGGFPTILKAFIDRTFMMGFGYQFHEGKIFWDKLLKGRSSHTILTMDTPPWVYCWLYGDPGAKAMAKTVMDFCGIGPNRITRVGMVRRFSEKQRLAWLKKIRRMGQKRL